MGLNDVSKQCSLARHYHLMTSSISEQRDFPQIHDNNSTIESCDSQKLTTETLVYLEGNQKDLILPDDQSDVDSLFDGDMEDSNSVSSKNNLSDRNDDDGDNANDPTSIKLDPVETAARLSGILIPGLFVFSTPMISSELASSLWDSCKTSFFRNPEVNQVMLFDRARTCSLHEDLSLNEMETKKSSSRIPVFLLELLEVLKESLKGSLPDDVYAMLFPTFEEEVEKGQARQAIVNHYRPGEGISPHVDLLGRYSDGIIGVSLNGGTVMDFVKVQGPEDSCGPRGDGIEDSPRLAESVYLPERSVIVLSGEARYEWTHGIARRFTDLVETEDGDKKRLYRGERISITFRWLLPGADVVGTES